MARYRTTVHSRLDIDEAFAYLADFAHSAEWDPGVVEARRLTEAPIGLGTRFRVVASSLGRRIPLEYEVTAYEPAERVELTAESAVIRSVDEITFTATATGTNVTYDAGLQGRGAFHLADPLLALAFRRIGDRARGGLQDALNR
jgi:Polyketide cyclase / dehydrase and lipid transport